MKLNKLGIFTCLVFVLLFLVLRISTAEDPSSNAFNLLQNLFPTSKISWEISFQGDIEKYEVTTGGIVAMTSDKTSKQLHYLSLAGERLWALWSEKIPFRDFQVSSDGERVIVVDVLNNAQKTHISVFNRTGEKLFELYNRGTLLSSPTGKYFYTVYSEEDPNENLRIFDNMGKTLWARKPEYAFWDIIPMSDKELALIEGDECVAYDVSSGEELWRYTLDPEFMIGEGIASSGEEYLTIYGGKNLYVLSKGGQLKWSKRNYKYFGRAAISPDGRYTIAQSEDKGEVYLTLFENKNGTIIWETKFERVSPSEIFQGLGDLTIDGGIIAATGLFGRSNNPERTLFLEFDQESGRLLREYLLSGRTDFIAGKEGEVSYYQKKSESILSKFIRWR